MKCIEDEIPFELPDGWAWARLGNIGEIITGGTPSKSHHEYYGNAFPFFKPADLDQGRKTIISSEYLSEKGKSCCRIIPKFSTAVCCIGSIGKCGYLNVEGTTNQQINSVIPNIDSLYAYYYCSSDYFLEQLISLASATTIAIVNKSKMESVLIPVPPMAEQQRIANTLDTELGLIATLEVEKSDIIVAINNVKSKILDLAIRGKLVPQDPNDEPASVLLERIRAEKEELIKQGKIKRDKKESVIFKGDDNSYYLNKDGQCVDIGDEIPFDIPNSWEWTLLGNIVQLNPRNKISDDMEVSFVSMPLIDDGFSGNHASEIRKWNDVKTGFTHFAEGDIGVAKITPCFENRKSTIFKNLCNGYGAGTTELHILRTYADTISHKFLLSFVKTDYFIQAGKQTFSGAVGQQRIGKEYISNSLFPLPPLAEQKRIVNTIEELFAQIDKIVEQIS